MTAPDWTVIEREITTALEKQPTWTKVPAIPQGRLSDLPVTVELWRAQQDDWRFTLTLFGNKWDGSAEKGKLLIHLSPKQRELADAQIKQHK
jgi:hypothetical protein